MPPLGDAVDGALQLARDAGTPPWKPITRARGAGDERRCWTMETEWRQAPQAVARQAQQLEAPLVELVRFVKRNPPDLVVTCARGSSAHSATFTKHLIERHLGIPVGAFAPNIATIYRRRLKLQGQLFLTVSQSGRSDDLIELVVLARAAGALTATLVNDPDSPLAKASDVVLPMAAGPEHSVAATKSFVTSLSACLHIVADGPGSMICERRSAGCRTASPPPPNSIGARP